MYIYKYTLEATEGLIDEYVTLEGQYECEYPITYKDLKRIAITTAPACYHWFGVLHIVSEEYVQN